jgi:hypothetical protein
MPYMRGHSPLRGEMTLQRLRGPLTRCEVSATPGVFIVQTVRARMLRIIVSLCVPSALRRACGAKFGFEELPSYSGSKSVEGQLDR